jgi:RNA polymerase sigma factor (sigma-70 family)
MAVSLMPLWQSVCRAVADASVATDRELIARFAQAGDESAFEVLLRRHSALVLGVCRRVLGNEADAEDAFQATFLLLARKAATTTWHDSVAGFLYRTAHHVACKARTAAIRRSRREKQVQARPSANPLEQLSAQELLSILDEELLRLPERYRAPLVLCYLEGATRDEAAAQLGCPPATLKSWLERGREKLHRAVQRRGLTLAGVLGATALASGSSNVAAEALRGSVRAVGAVAAGRSLSGLVSTNVMQLVDGGLKVMALTRWRASLALLLLCGVFTAAALSWPGAGAQDSPAGSNADSKKAATAKPEQSKPATDNRNCRGRVLSPEGKPVPGARVVFVRQPHDDGGVRQDTVAAQGLTGPDGRFHLVVAPLKHGPREQSSEGILLAIAAGYGPGWTVVFGARQARDATLRLVKDDVPLQGRVVDLNGQPIAGATVRVLGVLASQAEGLGPWVKELRASKAFHTSHTPNIRLAVAATGVSQAALSDARGQFRLAGFGRERLVKLRFSGPTIETRDAYAMTRPGGTIVVESHKGEPQWGSYSIHGATFTHAAAPTRPVVGTVTDANTGKPVAGITIHAPLAYPMRMGSDGSIVTRTDREGRYRIVGVPRGAGQRIQVSPDPQRGYLPGGLTTGPAPLLDPVQVDFKLTRGILIHGRVTDKATGKPVRARVEYFVFTDNPYLQKSPTFRAAFTSFRTSRSEAPLTRSDGSFTVVGMPGRGIITATVPRGDESCYLIARGADRIKGFGSNGRFSTWPYIVHASMTNTLAGIDLPADKREATVNLVLDPGKTIKGTVVDPDGKPLSGVQVEGAWGYNLRQRGPLSTAEFALAPVDLDRPQPFFFTHHEKKLGAAVLVKGDRTDGLTIQLQPLAVITGRLLDPDDVPLAGREVSGYLENGQLNVRHGWFGFFRATTDNNGRFRAEVIPGVKVSASFVEKQGRLGKQVFRNLTLKPGQVHDVGDVKVDPPSQ